MNEIVLRAIAEQRGFSGAELDRVPNVVVKFSAHVPIEARQALSDEVVNQIMPGLALNDAADRLAEWNGALQSILRLADDRSLKTAYLRLYEVLDTKEAWAALFTSMLDADRDFAHIKSRLEEVDRIRKEIVKSANALMRTMQRLYDVAIEDRLLDESDRPRLAMLGALGLDMRFEDGTLYRGLDPSINFPSELFDRLVDWGAIHAARAAEPLPEQQWQAQELEILDQPRPLEVVRMIHEVSSGWTPEHLDAQRHYLNRETHRKRTYLRAVEHFLGKTSIDPSSLPHGAVADLANSVLGDAKNIITPVDISKTWTTGGENKRPVVRAAGNSRRK